MGERSSSRIDYMLIPQMVQRLVEYVAVDFRRGRQLQVILGRRPRDHLLVVVNLAYCTQHDAEVARLQAMRWDYDLMMEALKTGRGRRAFLSDLEEAMQEKGEALLRASELFLPDEHWQVVEETVRTVAAKHFAVGKNKSDVWRALAAEMMTLLAERRRMRFSLGTGSPVEEEEAEVNGRMRQATKDCFKVRRRQGRERWLRSGPAQRSSDGCALVSLLAIAGSVLVSHRAPARLPAQIGPIWIERRGVFYGLMKLSSGSSACVGPLPQCRVAMAIWIVDLGKEASWATLTL